jgi:hypothetical protein
MEQITEENVIVPPGAEKVLKAYNIPRSLVAEMISEADESIRLQQTELLSAPFSNEAENLRFAARGYLLKNKDYVIRIYNRYLKAKNAKNKLSPVISGVQVIKEKDYRPILPM